MGLLWISFLLMEELLGLFSDLILLWLEVEIIFSFGGLYLGSVFGQNFLSILLHCLYFSNCRMFPLVFRWRSPLLGSSVSWLSWCV